MELRYAAKVYLFNRSIQKVELTKSEFQMLYTVFINNDKRLIDIHKTLIQVNRETGYNYVIKYLKQLMAKGYVIRKGFQYTMTCEGINILKKVEQNLRKHRFVRHQN